MPYPAKLIAWTAGESRRFLPAKLTACHTLQRN
jgi:hypothetical protein